MQSPTPDCLNRHFVRFLLALCCAVLCLYPSILEAANRYVSKDTGLDTNSGTLANPWKTIQKAASTAVAGDQVYIRAGVYAENVTMQVSGSVGAGPITFQSYPGEAAIIDGTTLVPAANSVTALLRISNRSYLIFRDLEFRGYKTTLANKSSIAGIYISGTSHHIELNNIKVHDIEGLPPANGSANGIGIYGNNATAITNISLIGCEVYNLKTQSSESIVFNGNIDGFLVTNCSIHDCDNIGLDCIGFEGTSPNALLDQARNGVISKNLVYNIDSIANPAYSLERGAGGIYVDGGKDILIEGNSVHHCNIGVEVASENAGNFATNCIVRNNFIFLNHVGGLFLGGADAIGNGGTTNCSILNNTFFNNDTDAAGGGQIAIQTNTTNVTIKQNILVAGSFGSGNAFVLNPNFLPTDGNTLNYNLYYSPAGAANGEWEWGPDYIDGFGNWKTTSGQDAQSLFSDPKFVNITLTPDLHLQATSPARNAGETTFVGAVGEVEIDVLPRIAETRVDIGADEFVPTVTMTSTDFAAAEWTSGAANVGTITLSRTAGNTVSAPMAVNLTITGTATNGTDYTLIANGAIPAGATNGTVTITPLADELAEGSETAIFAISDVPGLQINGTVTPITVTITDRPLHLWRLAQFGANANIPAVSGDRADPDGDSRPNLLEYAIGTLPNTFNSGTPLTTSFVSNYLTGTLLRSTASPADVTLIGQVSSDLNTWITGTVVTNTSTNFTFRDTTLRSANVKRFLRVRVTP